MTLLDDTIAGIEPLDQPAMADARARQDRLTKPAGSLGRLEALAVQLAGIMSAPVPRVDERAIVVMAGDHGIAQRGVSAYPSEVTGQMVDNFLAGGAAINALGRLQRARLLVVDMGIGEPRPAHAGLASARLGPGTRDFSTEPAMTRSQAIDGIETGIAIATGLAADGVQLVVPGEMGIGNSTSAAAIVAALTGRPAADVTGRGTGVDDAGLSRKRAVIDAALALHRPDPGDPIGVLAAVGGFEIAGIVGLLLGAARTRTVTVLDGFIVGAAALLAVGLAPALRGHLIAGHRSAEPGHAIILETLGLSPLLDLDLRLGEGSGAAVALGIIDAAVRTHAEMATFEEAAVSGPGGT